jgi:hypothetical protein
MGLTLARQVLLMLEPLCQPKMFLYHPKLGGGEKTHTTPHLQWPRGQGEDLGRLMHTHMLILRYSKVCVGGNFHSNITKDLQLKWSSLAQREWIKREEQVL